MPGASLVPDKHIRFEATRFLDFTLLLTGTETAKSIIHERNKAPELYRQ